MNRPIASAHRIAGFNDIAFLQHVIRNQQTARRKLYEETGATQYELTCVCPYAVSLPQGEKEYGMLFFAHVEELGPLPPQSRMAEVQLWEHMPSDNWTYPDIQPFLVARIRDSYSV